MIFELDKQTIQDFEIFGNDRTSNSIFQFFNYTKTIGGKKCLLEIMKSPLTNIDRINKRRDSLKFISDIEFEIKINSGQFEFIEHYLNLNVAVLRNNFLDAYYQAVSYKLKPLNDYYIIQSGIQQLIYLFKHLNEKLIFINKFPAPKDLDEQIQQIAGFFEYPDIREILSVKGKISCVKLNRYDNLFRKKYKNQILEIIRIIYILDSYISVAKVARENKFSFPEYLSGTKPILSISGLFHPFIENAVPYRRFKSQMRQISLKLQKRF